MEYAIFALWVVYLVPFILAASRDHPRLLPILALNLALGWTVIGWLAALAWARSEPSSRPRLSVVPSPDTPVPEVRGLGVARRTALAALAAAVVAGGVGATLLAWSRAINWTASGTDLETASPSGVSATHVERLAAGGARLLRNASSASEAVGILPGGCDVVVLEERSGWKRVWKTATCLERAPGPSEGWIPADAASPR